MHKLRLSRMQTHEKVRDVVRNDFETGNQKKLEDDKNDRCLFVLAFALIGIGSRQYNII